MTEQELSALEGLCKMATPRPWYVTVTGEGKPCVSHAYEKDYHGLPVVVEGMIISQDGANLEFIAVARTAVPALIAEVRRLRGEMEKARRLRERLLGWREKDCPKGHPGSRKPCEEKNAAPGGCREVIARWAREEDMEKRHD
jgi:hypothetical protein